MAFFFREEEVDYDLDASNRTAACLARREDLEAERAEVDIAIDEGRGTRHLLLVRFNNLTEEIDAIDDEIDRIQQDLPVLTYATTQRLKAHLRAMLDRLPGGKEDR